jgi:hypothetical protein
LRRNLWQELSKGTIDMLVVGIANPIRMQQQSTQLRQFIQKGAVCRRHQYPTVGHHRRGGCCAAVYGLG